MIDKHLKHQHHYSKQFKDNDEIKRNINRLSGLISKGASVAFYPSAGTEIDTFDFSKLPVDFVICSDYGIKEKETGKIITVQADNNLCLRYIFESGIKLDAIFAIQDGANEGGNYEYVNSISFLGRVLPVLKDEFVLVSNMKHYFDFGTGPVKEDKKKDISVYRNAVYSCYEPGTERYSLKIYKKVHYKPHVITVGNGRTIHILRKSIWEDQSLLDAIFKGIHSRGGDISGYKQALYGYWPPHYMEDKLFDVFKFTTNNSIIPLLEFANKKKFAKVGLVPFAAGRYNEQNYDRTREHDYYFVRKQFEEWEEKFPKQIYLYYFNNDDFKDLINEVN